MAITIFLLFTALIFFSKLKYKNEYFFILLFLIISIKINLNIISSRYIIIIFLSILLLLISRNLKLTAPTILLFCYFIYIYLQSFFYLTKFEVTSANNYFFIFIIFYFLFSNITLNKNFLKYFLIIVGFIFAADIIIEHIFKFKILFSLILLKPVFNKNPGAYPLSIIFEKNTAGLITMLPLFIIFDYENKIFSFQEKISDFKKYFKYFFLFISILSELYVIIIIRSSGLFIILGLLLIFILLKNKFIPKPLSIFIYLLCFILIAYMIFFRFPNLKSSFEWRKIYWLNAIKYFLLNPVFGMGTGCYPESFFIFKNSAINHFTIFAHNIFLQSLSENGLIGFFLFWGFVILLLKKSYKNKNEFYLFIIIFVILFHNFYSASFYNRIILFILFGFLSQIRQYEIQKQQFKIFFINSLRAVLLVVLLNSFLLLGNSVYLKKSFVSLKFGNLYKFNIYSDKAIKFYPFNPANYILKAEYFKLVPGADKTVKQYYDLASKFSCDKRIVKFSRQRADK